MQVKKGVLGRKADAGGELDQMASPLNTYIMRLSDVYLTKAEALLGNQNSTSDPQALAAFNATRIRAKLDPKTSFSFDDLIRGRITVDPYEYGKQTACTFCPYKGVCGFDLSIDGYKRRKLIKKSITDLTGEEA